MKKLALLFGLLLVGCSDKPFPYVTLEMTQAVVRECEVNQGLKLLEIRSQRSDFVDCGYRCNKYVGKTTEIYLICNNGMQKIITYKEKRDESK